jgi:hypothetical protein
VTHPQLHRSKEPLISHFPSIPSLTIWHQVIKLKAIPTYIYICYVYSYCVRCCSCSFVPENTYCYFIYWDRAYEMGDGK